MRPRLRDHERQVQCPMLVAVVEVAQQDEPHVVVVIRLATHDVLLSCRTHARNFVHAAAGVKHLNASGFAGSGFTLSKNWQAQGDGECRLPRWRSLSSASAHARWSSAQRSALMHSLTGAYDVRDRPVDLDNPPFLSAVAVRCGVSDTGAVCVKALSSLLSVVRCWYARRILRWALLSSSTRGSPPPGDQPGRQPGSNQRDHQYPTAESRRMSVRVRARCHAGLALRFPRGLGTVTCWVASIALLHVLLECIHSLSDVGTPRTKVLVGCFMACLQQVNALLEVLHPCMQRCRVGRAVENGQLRRAS